MIEYKPKATNILLNIILVVLFVVIVMFFSRNTNNLGLLVVGIVGFYLISVLFSKKRILVIKIYREEKKVQLLYRKFLIIKKKETYPFGDIRCSFQIEIGPRGVKRKEFRLYHVDGILIVKIIPNFMGWSNGDIKEIYGLLKKSGIHH